MLNIPATTAKVDQLCRQLGLLFTVTRAGASIGTSYGIVGSAERANAGDSGVSNISVMKKTIYIPAPASWTPRPGDLFNASSVTYRVVGVEEYKPGATAVAYKVTVE